MSYQPCAMASSALPTEEEEEDEGREVVRRGYLRRWEQPSRAYFVLRGGSHRGPGRLESYCSEEEFLVAPGSACHTMPCGCGSNRVVVYLCCCLGVTKSDGGLDGHTVALYARGQTVVLVAQDQDDQRSWYLDVKRLVDEERTGRPRDRRQDSGDGEETLGQHGEGGESFDREDDGYCTLASNTFFKEVWSVSVKPCGLGLSMSVAGDACYLCLSATSLVLSAADAAVGSGGDLPSLTFPLRSVRNLGHNGSLFFMEVGGLSPFGPGKIWMEARERGDPGQAQHMHEAIRETMQALRLLPDFSLSSTTTTTTSSSSHGQQQSRPRVQQLQAGQTRDQPSGARDDSGYMEMLSSPVSRPFRCPPESPACASSPCTMPVGFSPHGRPSQTRGGSGYMVMSPGKLHEFAKARERRHRFSPRATAATGAAGGREEYVMMRPQDGRRHLSRSSDDTYVPMKSPLSLHFAPMTLFYNAASHSALCLSDGHATESSQPASSGGSPSCLAQVQGVVAGLQPANGRPIVPVQATPTAEEERPTARRYRLSACLPSCLQTRER